MRRLLEFKHMRHARCAMVSSIKTRRTMFDGDDKNYQVDSAFLANSAGEKSAIEVVRMSPRGAGCSFQQTVSKLTET